MKNRRREPEENFDAERSKRHKVTFAEIDPPLLGREEQEKGELEPPSYDEIERIRSLRKQKARGAMFDYFDAEDGNKVSAAPDEPPMEPFSMDEDLKLGRFDSDGTFVFTRRRGRNVDSEADLVHDSWLDSLENDDKDAMNQRTIIHNQMEQAFYQNNPTDDSRSRTDMMRELCDYLLENETPADALRRLKNKAREENLPAKFQSEAEVSTDKPTKPALRQRVRMSSSDQTTFDRITQLTNDLMATSALYTLFTMTKEEILAIGEIRAQSETNCNDQEKCLFQFRWKKSGDSTVYGPYSAADVTGWIKTGYISSTTPVEMREVTESGEAIDGTWRDWKFFQLDAPACAQEDEDEEDEKKQMRNREENEESDEEEVCI